MRIVVLGYIVRGPIGGLAFHHLQYVAGLVRLGHDVLFLEDSDDYPCCYDPSRHVIDEDPTYGLRFADDAFSRLGLELRWSYYDAHTARFLGPAASRARDFCANADVALNISGVNPLRDWTRDIPVRVFVDTDPVFIQVRNLSNAEVRERSSQHNVFFSFAENIGTSKAQIPDDGFHWRATRQPIVLDMWKPTPPTSDSYTTVMQWASYAPVKWNGVTYATKSASFEEYIDLPQHTDVHLEVALGGEGAPAARLREKGWSLTNPLQVAATPGDYRNYIEGSRGEFSVAKHGYVVSNSGWFSERSACYLASGRPVVTQETGFSAWLPVGDGLFSFRDKQEAVRALREIESNYEHHTKAARTIAQDYFDSSEVLTRLLTESMSAAKAAH